MIQAEKVTFCRKMNALYMSVVCDPNKYVRKQLFLQVNKTTRSMNLPNTFFEFLDEVWSPY